MSPIRVYINALKYHFSRLRAENNLSTRECYQQAKIHAAHYAFHFLYSKDGGINV